MPCLLDAQRGDPVTVTQEFADLAAFARSEHAYAKAVADPEFVEWAQRLGVLRTLTSDSLHVELAPLANEADGPEIVPGAGVHTALGVMILARPQAQRADYRPGSM